MSNTIIPIIIPTEPQKSDEELADAEAIRRYDDEPRREAFRQGARWGSGDISLSAVAAMFFGMVYMCFQVCAFIVGAMDGPRVTRFDPYSYMPIRECVQKGKWGYVFPGWKAGCATTRWLNE